MRNGCVEVSAPSHVHTGNIDINGGLGRLYGTLGFTLEEPRLKMKICRDNDNSVDGTSRGDVLGYVELFSKLYNVKMRVIVEEEIPPHVGLGSTTPIALGVGVAAAILSGRRYRLEEIALAAGRSQVSGLGYHAFMGGGFIVDGGFKPGVKMVPPLLARIPVPSKYRIVYAVPNARLDEILALKEREEEILESMPVMDEEMAARNSRIVLMGILPAALEGDWATAGRWLYEFNRGLGEYWASRQEGVYCCREVEEVVDFLMERGAYCACQSSWGPTVYGLLPSQHADNVYRELGELLERMGGGISGVSRVDNTGAVIRVVGDG